MVSIESKMKTILKNDSSEEKKLVWNVSFISLSLTVEQFVTNKFPVKRTPALLR